MKTKRFFVPLLAVLSIFIFSTLAWSSVEGTWDIEGKITATAKIKGLGSASEHGYGTDTIIFYPNGTFEKTGAQGTWTQNPKRKFSVQLDASDLETALIEQLETEWGFEDVTVETTELTFNGTESKDGQTLKGKQTWKGNISFWYYDEGVYGYYEGTYSEKWNFKGYVLTGLGTQDQSSADEQSPASIRPLVEILRQKLQAK